MAQVSENLITAVNERVKNENFDLGYDVTSTRAACLQSRNVFAVLDRKTCNSADTLYI